MFFNAHYDAQKVLAATRSGMHTIRHVFGLSSHEGILSPDGYHTSPTGVVGVLAMKLGSIGVGVGGAALMRRLRVRPQNWPTAGR